MEEMIGDRGSAWEWKRCLGMEEGHGDGRDVW